MKRIHSVLTALIVIGSVPARGGEITTSYEITVNDQKFTVNDSAPTNVVVDGVKLTLAARQKPEKIFHDGNLSFAFPAAHAVSREVEGGVTTWTLDGQDNVLILLRVVGVDAKAVAQETIAALKKQYGDSARQSSCRLFLGQESLSGKRITAEFAGETITQEIYELSAGTAGYILILQDSGETTTPETREVKKLLRETFRRVATPATKEVK